MLSLHPDLEGVMCPWGSNSCYCTPSLGRNWVAKEEKTRFFFTRDFIIDGSGKIREWVLKGCNGYVILVSNIIDNVNGNYRKAWSLMMSMNGCGFEWVQLQFHLGMLDDIFFDSAKANSDRQNAFNVNRHGWWIVSHPGFVDIASSDAVLRVYDENGVLKQSIDLPQILSKVKIPDYAEDKVFFPGVWPFEINNVCWPRC